MAKINDLSVGCGRKFHPAWTKIDMAASDPAVQAVNLIKGIPFETNRFDLVCHSQVLEHIPKDKAPAFLAECMRVLKPGGILRVVVPDLEDLASEYLRLLRTNLAQPSPESEADYDWIVLEMYDQVVRHHSDGAMAEYLRQPAIVNEDYVVGRVGRVARNLIGQSRQPTAAAARSLADRPTGATPAKLGGWLRQHWHRRFGSEAVRVGSFRLGGKVHLWIYDRIWLSRVLGQAGLVDVQQSNARTSAAPDWGCYELDVRDGAVPDPASLFMEARKPSGCVG